MPYVVKADVGAGGAGSDLLVFDEKTMYRGKDVRTGDEVFVFDSENQGGRGLCVRGVVTAAEEGPGIRRRIEVRPNDSARRPLGRDELKPYRDLDDDRPETEVARKLYRQATNKIAGISEETAAFLRTYF
jgi:hypothetical protein